MTFSSCQTNTIRVILKNVLALPSFIMAVIGGGGVEILKQNKEHSSVIKSAPHSSGGVNKGLLSRIDAFV